MTFIIKGLQMKYHQSRKKQILLAITGMSPQVVTETLYGIHCNNQPWPDEIHIITTAKGKEQARLGLITPSMNNKTVIEQLCHDYQRPIPYLTEAFIHVIPDANGIEVDDARTKSDQEALADYIVKAVAQLCQDKNTTIHASIAGGRKTMTFFLGYAMALFARDDDSLSHVLVDSSYEGLRDFYYPTPYTFSISGRNENDRLDASKAIVMLADIPFIRHYEEIDNFTLSMFTKGDIFNTTSNQDDNINNMTYSDLVYLLNLAKYPEKNIPQCQLFFDLSQQRLYISLADKYNIEVDFSSAKMELAFYAMIARQSHPYGIKIFTPKDSDEKNKQYCFLFFNELLRIEGCNEYEIAHLTTIEQQMEQFSTCLDGYSRTIRSLYNERNPDASCGIEKTFFNDRKNKLKERLQQYIPEKLTSLFLPTGIFSPDGERLDYSTKKHNVENRYGIWVKSNLTNDDSQVCDY